MSKLDKNRLNHSLSVARKMVEIGKKYNLKDKQLEEIFLIGYNHDIGYELQTIEYSIIKLEDLY